ncbi:MAG TPA: protein translocase subunit SecD, partial [candidate division Zixibacteria bacterium]|nr:protein translocase subunit SecD [candidate division Zixibacteria bacterium]
SLWFVYPSVRLLFLSAEEKQKNPELVDQLQMKGVKLGLDLQGGVHLVFEVDTTKLPPDIAEIPIDEALEVIRSRVDQFGVAEPTIQKVGNTRIIVELPGIQDVENAKKLIQETAVLEFRLMRDPRDVQRFLDKMDKLLTEHPELLERAQSPVSAETTKVAKVDTTTSPPDRTAMPQPADTAKPLTMGELKKQQEAKDTSAGDTTGKVMTAGQILGKEGAESTAAEEEETPGFGAKPFSSMVDVEGNSIFVPISKVEVVDRLLKMPEVQDLLKRMHSIMLWAAHPREYQGLKVKELFMLKDKVELTGDHLVSARWRFGSGADPRTAGKPVIDLEFDRQGARIFSKVTGYNIKKRLAIVLNDKVYTAPVIQTKIRNGRAMITGINDIEEAKIITIVLKAGALPVPLKIIEERTVGPSLGEDSIRKGVTAMIIGLLVVMLFMLIYYKFAGLVADIALLLNILILMAALALVHATLTLPGIAGIILTIGMAVDANVLIYERIREEIRAGRTIRMAIEAGYSRAILTIIDANITTLVAAIVLYYFGTGPIRGFAVTLSLGLVVSMYTAIIVTRMIFDWYVAAFKKETIAI